jgi:hypothetical protein
MESLMHRYRLHLFLDLTPPCLGRPLLLLGGPTSLFEGPSFLLARHPSSRGQHPFSVRLTVGVSLLVPCPQCGDITTKIQCNITHSAPFSCHEFVAA